MTARPLRPFAPLSEIDEPFASPARKKSGTMRKAARFEPPPPELCHLFPVPPDQVTVTGYIPVALNWSTAG